METIIFEDLLDELRYKEAAAIRVAETDMKNYFMRVQRSDGEPLVLQAKVCNKKRGSMTAGTLMTIVPKMPLWLIAIIRSGQDLYLFGKTSFAGNCKVVKGMIRSGRYPLWKIGEAAEQLAAVRDDIQMSARGC